MSTSASASPHSDRFVPASVAAHLSGVDPRTIRRWASSGQIPVIPSARGRLVDLVAVRRLAGIADPVAVVAADITRIVADLPDPVREDAREDARDVPAHGSDADPGIGELVRHIAGLEQTILELSGRCGWLQAQLEVATTRIRELEAPPAAPAEATDQAGSETSNPNHPAASQNGPDSGAECPPPRPWWKFWERT